ncbi:MAG TPA: serine protease [Solirubrobacteraceae bacterium]|jgi:hypothetical protein
MAPLSDRQLITRVQQLGDPATLETWLTADPGAALRHAAWPREARPHTRRAIVVRPGLGSDDAAADAAFEVAGHGGRKALVKVRREGIDAKLDAAERDGLEAIVQLIGRPAILVQDGRFFPPPASWERLEEQRAAIERTIASVGRIEVDGHPTKEWIGTGFVVAPGVVMTNRHVVEDFADATTPDGWRFKRGMKVRIDFAEELGTSEPRELPVKAIIGVSDRVDMALLRIGGRHRGRAAPPPLAIAGRPRAVAKGREVYVVGYPALDSRHGALEEQRRIFTNVFDVKRLQPGYVTRTLRDGLFEHDCSTLGGNSGSCVVDLETHEVVGLHFKGHYLVANTAVNLSKLADDPLLREAEVPFA